MGLSDTDRLLIAEIQDGLPLVHRPYAEVGAQIGLSEAQVIEHLHRLIDQGAIRRWGVVVRHHELGYRANAMVVWDVPRREVRAAGERLARLPFVTLCYQRPRRLPNWPYNLFCMIHGRDRDKVAVLIERAAEEAGLKEIPRAALFSRRRFKQRGARYGARAKVAV